MFCEENMVEIEEQVVEIEEHVELLDEEENTSFNGKLSEEDAISCPVGTVKNGENVIVNSGCTNSKETWSENEVIALIKGYDSHKENFKNTKRKKVWTDISNELSSNGFEKTATKCEIKWKNLLSTYKNVKTFVNRTGRGPTKFKFFKEMDRVLSEKPVSDCSYTISSIKMNGTNSEDESRDNLTETDGNNEINDTLAESNIETSTVKLKAKDRIRKHEQIMNLKIKYMKRKEEEYLEKKERKRRKEEREERLLALEEKKLKLFEKYLKSKAQ